MPNEEHEVAEQADLELLRRRLYRPDASDEDRQRFAELDAGSVAAAPDPPRRQEATGVAARWRRRRGVLAAGTAVIVLAGLVIAIRAERPDATPFTARTQDDGSTSDQQVRADLVRPSADAPTPSAIPTAIGGVATEVQRFRGTGTTVVSIDTRVAQQKNGTLLVMLTSASDAQLSWFATRASARSDRPGFAEIVAEGDPESGRQDVPSYGLHEYDGAPPNRLVVQTSNAVRWTLTVGFLPRKNLPY